MYSPNKHVKIFGQGFVHDYAQQPRLVIGKDQWTGADLVKMGVYQTRACAILSGIAKQLRVQSLKDLYDSTTPYTFADFPAGIITLFVLFAAFDDKDLDAQAWYLSGREHALTTFLQFKKRELKAKERERLDKKKRSRQQRRTSHEAGVAAILGRA